MEVINANKISQLWAVNNTERAIANYMSSDSFENVKSQIYRNIRNACDRGEPAVVVKLNSILTYEDISPVLLSVAIRRELTSQGYKVDFNANKKKRNDLQVLIIWGYESSEGEDK